MTGQTKIDEVCRYIYLNMGTLSSMKLQKLLYYAKVWHFVWTGKELFKESFHATQFGPAEKTSLDKTAGQFIITPETFAEIKENLTKIEKESIDKVLEHYGEKTSQWLIKLTKLEDPWMETKLGEDIKIEKIKEYYSNL